MSSVRIATNMLISASQAPLPPRADSLAFWLETIALGWSINYVFPLINLNLFPSQHFASGDTSDSDCPGNLTWNDPTDDTLTAFNEMMFRSTIRSSGNQTGTLYLVVPNATNKTLASQSTVSVTQSSTRNIFLTNFTYLVEAVAVMT